MNTTSILTGFGSKLKVIKKREARVLQILVYFYVRRTAWADYTIHSILDVVVKIKTLHNKSVSGFTPASPHKVVAI